MERSAIRDHASRIPLRSMRATALRQTAQTAAAPTVRFNSVRHNEIDRCALKCQAYLPFQSPVSAVCDGASADPPDREPGSRGDCAMALRKVTLDDKYDLGQERVFVTGYQALIRLTLMQKERDPRAGLNTAGYVSGYLGSPLGGLDQQFLRAKPFLDRHDIVFQAGINEDLAATALWGTQQAELRGEGKYDGVFGMWYGKGPGVDRTGDVFRPANFAGTSPHGGVLALMGDDHTAESSTTAHQSEYHFVDVMIPILNPAGVQEIIDYGLYGYAMSRFCGT